MFAKEWLPGTVCSALYWALFDFATSLNLRQVEKSNLNMQENILMNIFYPSTSHLQRFWHCLLIQPGHEGMVISFFHRLLRASTYGNVASPT